VFLLICDVLYIHPAVPEHSIIVGTAFFVKHHASILGMVKQYLIQLGHQIDGMESPPLFFYQWIKHCSVICHFTWFACCRLRFADFVPAEIYQFWDAQTKYFVGLLSVFMLFVLIDILLQVCVNNVIWTISSLDFLLRHIWQKSLDHVKNVIQNGSKHDSVDVLQMFLQIYEDLVENQTVSPEILLVSVEFQWQWYAKCAVLANCEQACVFLESFTKCED